jgi:hypothetical protein
VLALSACEGENTNKATKADEEQAEQQLDQFQKAQPVPSFNWSQLRQNLIELERSQANTTATTSFFFNVGVQKPVTVCPSIGFPIPATFQLTNPQQIVTPGPRERGTATVDQLDPTGVYSGDTSGTYVICVDGNGRAYAQYWEGYVGVVTGPAEWDGSQIKLTGAPSATFTTGK